MEAATVARRPAAAAAPASGAERPDEASALAPGSRQTDRDTPQSERRDP